MPKVTVEPTGVVLEQQEGDTILARAKRHRTKGPSLCGGEAACTTRFVKIVDGMDRLPEAKQAEHDARTLDKRVASGEIHLACQLTPGGDVRVRKRAIKPRPVG